MRRKQTVKPPQITPWHAEGLIELLRERYEDWGGFDHDPFVSEEVVYKRKASTKAQTMLGKQPFSLLIEEENWYGVMSCVEKIGRTTNLLWQSVPKKGDLSLLYDPRLDKAAFAYALFALLHGAEADSAERLDTYTQFVHASGLPNKWTLPTYLLFLLNPETDCFVKPRTIDWFFKYIGDKSSYYAKPNGTTYRHLLQHVAQLKHLLKNYHPADNIDMQSVIWIAFRESKGRTGGLSPRAQVELDQPPTFYRRPPSDTLAIAEAAPVTANNFGDGALPRKGLAEIAQISGWPQDDLHRWVKAIHRKGQAILVGPPGTGKTYLARELAAHLVGGGDGFIELVQFHPAYSYEDFIQGIRPIMESGQLSYEMVAGRFLQFIEQAKACSDHCVLIIDEINRAHLTQVFGELMYLLEYRDQSVPLAGGGMLKIPANVRILGTMNTADRSIALVDNALRRRFAFLSIRPNFDILRHHLSKSALVDPLIAILTDLNSALEPAYHIGITYFLGADLATTLPDIWQMEIEPYLEEYFYSQPERVDEYRWSRLKNRILN